MATLPDELHTTLGIEAVVYHMHDEVRVRTRRTTDPTPRMSHDGPDRTRVDYRNVTYRCPQCGMLVEVDAAVTGRPETSLDADRAWFHDENL